MGILIRSRKTSAQVRAIPGMDQRRRVTSGGRACRQWNSAQKASSGSVSVEPSMGDHSEGDAWQRHTPARAVKFRLGGVWLQPG
ncbi:hypothetical protein CQ048_11360 [Pseudomonas trivialis]|nr:hypothetical protein CQ048_11360 [Pseudomonas trivialis]PRB27993.1 hypothetical protein CQ041_09390 [Pseudomonas sp. MYb60]